MGNNNDPITLHKYLYANGNPVTYVDPTGNFSLVSFAAADTIRNILSEMTIEVGTSLLDAAFSDGDTAGPNVIGAGIASIGGPAAFKLLGMLSSKFRKACNSFDADTEVWTEDGIKFIPELNIGDKVWALNEETGELELQNVVHLIQREGEYQLIEITVGDETIDATENHPFYVKGKDGWEWEDATSLVVNDVVQDKEGKEQRITKINIKSHSGKVFNLTVDNIHTYLVGQRGVVAHNADTCKPIGNHNLRHIMSGDKFGGGHSINGVATNFLGVVSKKLPNGVYEGRVKNPVDGFIETKTFFPDSWDAGKIRLMINKAYGQHITKGGKGLDFKEWVKDGNNKIYLRVELAPGNGGNVVVRTAHPIYKK